MFIEFINQNIWWFVALVVVANLLLWSIVQGNVAGANMVSALEMPRLQRQGKSLLLDVNKMDDYARGHIPSSVSQPIESLDTNDIKLAKFKDKTVILVCQNGARSAKAAKSLIKAGYSDVNILRGGLMSWTKENLPITSDKTS